ncbi:ATP-binding protein [Candidatus Woesearchaeota archaeon]|nr:ATP-binding protein [Candidatus Woesearchaeota archaeon]
MTKGLIIGGQYGNIIIRQKNDEQLELGEILVAETKQGKILLQAFDLLYGSQLTQQHLELVSGIKLEEDQSVELMDPGLRTYLLARLKSLAYIQNQKAASCKALPTFFTHIREIQAEDVKFLTQPPNALELGNLRSGSKVLDVPVNIDGQKALQHHILIAGTTGRGKSVLMTNLLRNTLDEPYCAMLVLDPHNEYYERLDKTTYYTMAPPPGGITLKINTKSIQPRHFDGAVDWSDPQKQALNAYYNEYKQDWIEAIVLEKPIKQQYHEATLAVIRRTIMQLLRLAVDDEQQIHSSGPFDTKAGETTIIDIINTLEQAKTVIIDTSSFHGSQEILIGSMISNAVLDKYKNCTQQQLKDKPVISIVIEEAPRVLGKEVLERGPNIFSTIAREGRKFKVGLTAITQLPSLIPRQVLANINTKIILGIELKPERQAIIESAAQDLSDDERMIASLDKGEAIITSNFLSFAMPVKIPYNPNPQKKPKIKYEGLA